MSIRRRNTNKYNAVQHKREQLCVHLSQQLGCPPVPLGLGAVTDLISLLSWSKVSFIGFHLCNFENLTEKCVYESCDWAHRMLSLFFLYLRFRADPDRPGNEFHESCFRNLSTGFTFHKITPSTPKLWKETSSSQKSPPGNFYTFFFLCNELISCLVNVLNLLQCTYYKISCSFPTSSAKRWCVVGSRRYSPRDRLWIITLLPVICVSSAKARKGGDKARICRPWFSSIFIQVSC